MFNIQAQLGAMQQEEQQRHYPSAPIPTLARNSSNTNESMTGGHAGYPQISSSSPYPSLRDFMGNNLSIINKYEFQLKSSHE